MAASCCWFGALPSLPSVSPPTPLPPPCLPAPLPSCPCYASCCWFGAMPSLPSVSPPTPHPPVPLSHISSCFCCVSCAYFAWFSLPAANQQSQAAQTDTYSLRQVQQASLDVLSSGTSLVQFCSCCCLVQSLNPACIMTAPSSYD